MTKRIEFKPPKGVVPEGSAPDDTFDLVCSFRVKKNGDICLVQLGDTQMPGYNDSGKAGASYENDAKEMVQSAPESGGY
jgi:hypothetical protein